MIAPLGIDIARAVRPGLHANMGGPMSRTRRERIATSVLGKAGGRVRCPCIIRAGLRFAEGDDPVEVLGALLAEEGHGSPEDLRAEAWVPAGRLICRPMAGEGGRLAVARASRRDVLAQALILGLCTRQLYDPARPVLWTRASLTRAVELFDPAGFYA